jgi:hypothetical protein
MMEETASGRCLIVERLRASHDVLLAAAKDMLHVVDDGGSASNDVTAVIEKLRDAVAKSYPMDCLTHDDMDDMCRRELDALFKNVANCKERERIERIGSDAYMETVKATIKAYDQALSAIVAWLGVPMEKP